MKYHSCVAILSVTLIWTNANHNAFSSIDFGLNLTRVFIAFDATVTFQINQNYNALQSTILIHLSNYQFKTYLWYIFYKFKFICIRRYSKCRIFLYATHFQSQSPNEEGCFSVSIMKHFIILCIHLSLVYFQLGFKFC